MIYNHSLTPSFDRITGQSLDSLVFFTLETSKNWFFSWSRLLLSVGMCRVISTAQSTSRITHRYLCYKYLLTHTLYTPVYAWTTLVQKYLLQFQYIKLKCLVVGQSTVKTLLLDFIPKGVWIGCDILWLTISRTKIWKIMFLNLVYNLPVTVNS